MKFLKRIDESWSADYTYDFTDNGFEVEETGNTIKGKYKGKFLITQVSSWFAEMVAKMESDHRILNAKTYNNEVTGNASFEVEIAEEVNDAIEVAVGTEKVKFFPISTTHITQMLFSSTGTIEIIGALENGQKKLLRIYRSMPIGSTKADAQKSKATNGFSFGSRSRGISVDNENIKKIFDIIEAGQIINYCHFSDEELNKRAAALKAHLLS
jgi:hypothetical protein